MKSNVPLIPRRPQSANAATLGAVIIALAIPALTPRTAAASPQYADSVSNYQPGAGVPAGYNDPAAAVGEPSRSTPGQFGGPVDPYNAPWTSSQLLSIGTGGSVTAQFNPPIENLASHPFGLDFLIFTSAAFMITNGDYTAAGVTDGTLFGDNPGSTRVSVSPDGVHFYLLDPALAPTVDGYFPTDGSGDFTRPVNPALKGSDFNGLDLAGIRVKYDGSGGGTGYDISWARDGAGNPVTVDQVQSVRVDVISGRADIDGFSVVPEPGPAALGATGFALLLGRRMSRRAPRPCS